MGSLLLLGIGGKAGAGAASVLDGVSGLTAAYSASRKLLTAYGGSLYTDVAGEMTVLFDQSGNARDLAHSAGTDDPQVGTAGANSRVCATFDGVAEDFRIPVTVTNLITASAGYVISSVIVDAVTTNNASVHLNDAIFSDSGQFIGYHLKSAPSGHAYNWDGTGDSTTNASFPIGTTVVVEWKHESGNIQSRLTASGVSGSWQSVASGNTTTLTGFPLIFHGAGGFVFTQGKLFEMAWFNAVPTTLQQDAFALDFNTWTG